MIEGKEKRWLLRLEVNLCHGKHDLRATDGNNLHCAGIREKTDRKFPFVKVEGKSPKTLRLPFRGEGLIATFPAILDGG